MRFWTTANESVAMALLAAGEHLSEEQPVFHIYTDEFLRRHGADSFEDARDRVIPMLKQKGITGSVTYVFEHTDALNALLVAYDDQRKKMKEGATVILPNIVPEEAVRLAATMQHNTLAAKRGCLAMVPMMSVARGEGYIAVPANASQEILEHFQLT